MIMQIYVAMKILFRNWPISEAFLKLSTLNKSV